MDVEFALKEAGVPVARRLVAGDLLAWLLQTDPLARPQSATAVLSHPFMPGGGGKLRMSALHQCCGLSEAQNVRQAIADSTVDLCACEPALQRSPLHFGAVAMHEDIVRILLQATVARDTSGEIHRDVSVEPDVDVFTSGQRFVSLIAREASKKETGLSKVVNAKDATGDTPLHALLGNVEFVDQDKDDMAKLLRVCELLAPLADPEVEDASGRTVYECARATSAKAVRDLFLKLQVEQTAKKRRELFTETVIHSGASRPEPWGLGAGELKAWILAKIGARGGKYFRALVAAMDTVDGVTILSTWVQTSGPSNASGPIFGKMCRNEINNYFKKQFPEGVKFAAITELAKVLGLVDGGLSYYKAIFQSCEKRSLLTDYEWKHMCGEGGFGRAHLCRCDSMKRCDWRALPVFVIVLCHASVRLCACPMRGGVVRDGIVFVP